MDRTELSPAQFLEEIVDAGRTLTPDGVEVGRRFVTNEEFSSEGFDAESSDRVLGLLADYRQTSLENVADPLFDVGVVAALYRGPTGSQSQLAWVGQQTLSELETRISADLQFGDLRLFDGVASWLELGDLADGVVAYRMQFNFQLPGYDDIDTMYVDSVLFAVDNVTVTLITTYLFDAPSDSKLRTMALSLEQVVNGLLSSTTIVE